MPEIKHVFLIVLTGHGFGETFSPVSTDTYLNHTLAKQGKLINNYYAVAPSSLANEIALVSGQGPTAETASNCPVYFPVRQSGRGAMEQVLGSGCVYPSRTPSIADQLGAKKRLWRAYVEQMAPGPRGAAVSCRHPAIGQPDPNHTPTARDPYLTWRNPFVYFASLQAGKRCAMADVGLGRLATDLRSTATTPALAYIVPDACDNGADHPCAPGARAGLPPANAFLKRVIPQLEHSPAYKDHSLIAVTFDEAPQNGVHADPSACCNNPAFPNLTAAAGPGTSASTGTGTSSTGAGTVTTDSTSTTSTGVASMTTTSTPAPFSSGGQTTPTGGGGQVGLLLISRYVKPGTVDLVDYYNHFSLLASVEKLFDLSRLGYAGDLQLPIFDASVLDGTG